MKLISVADPVAVPKDALESDDGTDAEVVTVTAGGRGLTIAGVFPNLPPVHRFEPTIGLVRRQNRPSAFTAAEYNDRTKARRAAQRAGR